MNKTQYRIVFNVARGCLMAVAETAHAQGKTAAGESHSASAGAARGGASNHNAKWRGCATLARLAKALAWGLPLFWLQAPIYSAAQTVATRIIADTTAPKTQQATVLTSGNGVVQVNIQTPSSAGVSRNTYSQFDVGKDNAILNNSRTNVQTQLGGWVQGNPWLANGTARVILNEVNASNPSQLKGYIEVAGSKAQVIMANPAGITIDGAGFINANHVTLTTGNAVMNGGNLDAFKVQGGTIQIDGQGLDHRNVDYTAILARAVQVNAGLWANELKIVTGANHISATSLGADQTPSVSPIGGAGGAPAVALDVAQLGGMYAGKIMLIGTEAGVGVRNSGLVQTSSGPLTLSHNGWLANSGTLSSATDLTAQTQGRVDNSGTVYAKGQLDITSQATQNHSGTTAALGAVQLRAQGQGAELQSTPNALIAAGLQADGSLVPGADLSAQATGQAALHGRVATLENILVQGDSIDISQSRLSATQAQITALQGDLNATASNINITRALDLNTPQTLRTDAAQVQAETLRIQAQALSNVGGKVAQQGAGDLNIRLTGDLNNSGGTLQSNSQNMNLQAANVVNDGGQIGHAGTGSLNITTEQLSNQSQAARTAQIISNGQIALQTQTLQSSGTVSAAGDLQITAQQTLVAQGTNVAAGSMTLQGQSVDLSNSQTSTGQGSLRITATQGDVQTVKAKVMSAAALDVQGKRLDNTQGLLQAAQNLNLDVTELNNTQGQITTGQNLALQLKGQLTNSGNVYAAKDLSTTAASLVNSGSLYASGNQTLNTSGQVSNTGTLAAQVDLSLSAASLAATNTSVMAAGMAADGKLTGAPAGTGTLAVSTTGALQSAGQVLATNGMALSGAHVNLAGSQTGTTAGAVAITATAGDVNTSQAQVTTPGQLNITANSLATQTLNNTGGVLSADQVRIQTGQLNNSQGQIVQTGTDSSASSAKIASIQTGALNNTSGVIAANARDLSISSAALNNTSGTIQHAGTGTLSLAASSVDNTQGLIVGNSALTLTSTGAVLNSQGTLTTRSDLQIRATSLDNTLGKTTSGQIADIRTTQTLTNAQGVVAAANNLNLQTGSIDNQSGTMAAINGDVTITTTQGSVNNRNGSIQSGQDVTLRLGTNALSNASGQIQALRDLSSTGGAIDNTQGKISATGHLSIDTQGQNLNNSQTHTAQNNLGLLAGGSADLRTGNLDNQGGLIHAQGLTIAADALNNQLIIASGTQAAQTALIYSRQTMRLQLSDLDNRGSQVLAVNDMAIDAGAGQINNTTSLIRSAQTIALSAGNILNGQTLGTQRNGSPTDQGIEAQNIHITANDFNNSQGAVRASGNLTVQGDGTFNNANGLLSAGQTLNITPGSTATPTLRIDNTNGRIIADSAIHIQTGQLINTGGQVQSKGDVLISLQGDHTTAGLMRAGRDLSLLTTNTLTHNVSLQAGRNLTVGATNIDNTLTGEFVSGATTQLTANNQMTNRGLVDGADTRVNVQTLNNIGTGRLYGDRLTVTATNLYNQEETANGATIAATLAAREQMSLTVQNLVNREHALIYSAGDMLIAGGIDANGQVTSTGQSLTNASATIDTANNLTIRMAEVNNTNNHFVTQVLPLGSPQAMTQYQLAHGDIFSASDFTTHYEPSDAVVFRCEAMCLSVPSIRQYSDSFVQYDFTRNIQQSQVTQTDPGRISAGRNIGIVATHVTNDQSQFLAGNALSMNAVSLNNVAKSGIRIQTDEGTATSYWRRRLDGPDTYSTEQTVYIPGDVQTNITIVTAQNLSNNSASPASSSPTAKAVNTVTAASDAAKTVAITSLQGPSGPESFQLATAQSRQAAATITQTATPASTGSAANSASGQSTTTQSIAQLNTNPSTSKAATSPATQVRTLALPASIPNTSLFKTHPESTSKYLVETDPQFANYKTWLSTDFMTTQLQFDPTITQKRLGDGFYEQKLIREQIAQLTGQRFLGDFQSDDQQFQALMNNGLTFAKSVNLRPGIALSDAQIASLTSDMVWLVQQTVTLADGSQQAVLVPQVYVRVRAGDLDGSGALLAGKDIKLNLSGDLTNSGTIAGRNVMSITAENISNLGGQLSADQLSASARQDLNNLGGVIQAQSAASVTAGRDLNLITTTQSSGSAVANSAGGNTFAQTGIDRVAGLFVKSSAGTLVASAGRDFNLAAAQVSSAGSASLSAGRDINLGTVTTSTSQSLNWDASNHLRQSSSQDVGSQVGAGGNLTMRAGNDINAKAANVNAGATLDVKAARDINILVGEDKQSDDSASKRTSSGFLSSTTTTTQSTSASDKAIASTFTGNNTRIVAERNLNSVGGVFTGTDSLLVQGQQDQKFYAATDTSTRQTSTQSSSSLLGFVPVDKSSTSTSQSQTLTLGSKLISDKAITVNIGNSADFSGAQISAATTRFNNLDASKPGSLNLGGALETQTTSTSSSSETLGLTQKSAGSGSTTQTLKLTTIQGEVQFDKGLQVSAQLPNVVATSGLQPNASAGAAPAQPQAVSQQAVQSQLDNLSQQPGLGYLKQLQNNPNVKWEQVKTAQDQWSYSQQGLTPAGAALLSIAVAASTGGMGTELLGTTTAATGTAAGAALNAGFSALAAQTSVAMANNGGDIGKTLQQLGSNQSVKALLTTIATAGALQGLNETLSATGQSGAGASGVNGIAANQAANQLTQNLTRNLTNNLAGAVIDSAINNKPLNADTLASAFKGAIITAGLASGANTIGDAAAQGSINSLTQQVAHAVLGCAGGAATTGSGCAAGAVGAVVGELAAGYYMDNKQDPKLSAEQNKANALAFAKVMSAASGIVAGGGGDNVAAVNVAATTGANAAVNNYLLHNKLKDEEGELLRLKKQKESAQCDTNCNTRIKELETLDKLRDEQLAPVIAACEKAGRNNCKGEAIAQNFAQANGFGAESMKRETNAGSSSPFSFNNCPASDKGGCSYGPLQIAADTGMMNSFIEGLRKNPSDEAQSFYKELQSAGGVSASQNKDPVFLQTWMKLTAKDPQFVQYQIDALVNQNLYPVVQELQKVGVDFNTLSTSQKEAIFSAAVQHGAGTGSKSKGADNVMERAISIAQTDAKAPSFPTYTRQELVYGQVEDQMQEAEKAKAKLITQQKDLITQRESLITQRESLITQQLNLERQKSQLLEQGLGASSSDVQKLQTQVKTLDQKINSITEQVAPITSKVNGITTQVMAQDQYVQEAAQYLKSQAQGSLADGEQWLKDFYAQRTQMYPAEANRYKKELDSLLNQYREEQKAKGKK